MNPYGSRGRFYYDQSRYQEAITEFTKELSENPDDATLHAYISLSQTHLEQSKAALESARKAISLEPDSDFGFYALAIAENHIDHPKKAEAAIRQAIEIEPGVGGYYGTLAVILGRQNRWKAALEVAETGLSIEPENSYCAEVRAHAMSLAGMTTQAIDAAKSNISENPDSPHAHATLGWVYLRKGQHLEAQTHFKEALRLDPSEDLARDGLLDSLRARFPLYRWLIQFGAWHAQFSRAGQVVIFIAIFMAPRIVRSIARSNPQLQPFLIPVAVVMSLFIWFTWIGEAVTNMTLLTHPLGRLALPMSIRRESTALAAYFLFGVLSLIIGIWMPTMLAYAAICLTFFFLMALSTNIRRTLWLRNGLFWCLAGFGVASNVLFAVIKLAL